MLLQEDSIGLVLRNSQIIILGPHGRRLAKVVGFPRAWDLDARNLRGQSGNPYPKPSINAAADILNSQPQPAWIQVESKAAPDKETIPS